MSTMMTNSQVEYAVPAVSLRHLAGRLRVIIHTKCPRSAMPTPQFCPHECLDHLTEKCGLRVNTWGKRGQSMTWTAVQHRSREGSLTQVAAT